jgi:hypothetical protein
MASPAKNAARDELFVGAGVEAGVQVWRIEALKPVPNKEACSGKLCVGDSYIVLHSIPTKSGGFDYNLHFWLGAESSQDEKGCAVRGAESPVAHGLAVCWRYSARRCARSAASGVGWRAPSGALDVLRRAPRAGCAQLARWVGSARRGAPTALAEPSPLAPALTRLLRAVRAPPRRR